MVANNIPATPPLELASLGLIRRPILISQAAQLELNTGGWLRTEAVCGVELDDQSRRRLLLDATAQITPTRHYSTDIFVAVPAEPGRTEGELTVFACVEDPEPAFAGRPLTAETISAAQHTLGWLDLCCLPGTQHLR